MIPTHFRGGSWPQLWTTLLLSVVYVERTTWRGRGGGLDWWEERASKLEGLETLIFHVSCTGFRCTGIVASAEFVTTAAWIIINPEELPASTTAEPPAAPGFDKLSIQRMARILPKQGILPCEEMPEAVRHATSPFFTELLKNVQSRKSYF